MNEMVYQWFMNNTFIQNIPKELQGAFHVENEKWNANTRETVKKQTNNLKAIWRSHSNSVQIEKFKIAHMIWQNSINKIKYKI